MAKNLPVVPSAKPGSMAEAPSGTVWREQHPVVSDKCTLCLECTLFCPEGALMQADGRLKLVLEWCNGCGTCAAECRQGAITMLGEYSGAPGVFGRKGGKA